jgi:hypothetical protein
VARKSKPESELTPLLVQPEVVARLFSVTGEDVEKLIREGHLGVRTVNGHRLVRFQTVLEFAGRDDPLPLLPAE